MERRFATRIGAIRANQFARIDSQKNPFFHNVRAKKLRIASNLRFAALVPRSAIRKKGGSLRDPQAIRDHAIRANLRIDSWQSGHLSCRAFKRLRGPLKNLHDIRHSSERLDYICNSKTEKGVSVGLPRKQKIGVNRCWVQESETGEECRRF